MMIVYFFVCFYASLCFEFGSSIVYQHSTPGPATHHPTEILFIL